MHSHEDGYFCLVRQGSYLEAYGVRKRACGPLTFAFHPPGELHSEHFGDTEARSFNIEITSDWLGRMREHSADLEGPAHFQGGPLVGLALKLYREFRSPDPVSHIAIEGLILEIAAEASRRLRRPRGVKAPAWLDKVREILRERFAEGPALTDLAASVGVHPVYMATAFTRRYRCTVGEYVRQLRLEYACRELANSDKTLAEIAAQAGYADQSHMNRSLKNSLGITPAQYRAQRHLN
jgi:AraC family transcriptional regulator